MGTISEKLEYLNNTKSLLKDVIGYSGAEITSETTFRNYAIKLYNAYIDILKGEYSLIEGMPKGQVEGLSVAISDAENLPVYKFEFEKESSQHTTTGKNLFNDVFETGSISTSTGKNTTATMYKRTEKYTSVLPNTTYTFNIYQIEQQIVIFYYNDTNFLNFDYLDNVSQITFTTPNNCTNIRARVRTTNDIDKIQLEQGSIATDYEEYTGRQPSPNPDYPQEVKVVEGYRNLLNIANYFVRETRTNVEVNLTTGSLIATDDRNYANKMVWFNIPVENETTYKINYKNNTFTRVQYTFSEQSLSTWAEVNALTRTDVPSSGIITSSDVNLIIVLTMSNAVLEASIDNLIITEGTQEFPYAPYGNNYIAVNISNGTNINQVPLPLNGNKIAGIGNYLDEYIVDQNGHCWLNKMIRKKVLNGTEYFINMGWANKNGYRTNDIFENMKITTTHSDGPYIVCNYFTSYTQNGVFGTETGTGISNRTNHNGIIIRYDEITTAEDFKAWLSSHNTEVYYVLTTPELIDLNTVIDLKLFKGVNNITNSEDGNVKIQYIKELEQ